MRTWMAPTFAPCWETKSSRGASSSRRTRSSSGIWTCKLLDARLGDAVGNEGQRLARELVRHHDRLTQRIEAELDPRRIAREHRRDRLAGEHFVAGVDGDHEADRGIDRVLDLEAPTAHRDDGAPDDLGIDPDHHAGAGRLVHFDLLGLGQHRRILNDAGIPTLRFDHALELLGREAGAEGVLEPMMVLLGGLFYACG